MKDEKININGIEVNVTLNKNHTLTEEDKNFIENSVREVKKEIDEKKIKGIKKYEDY